MITVNEMIELLEKARDAGKGEVPVIALHWLGGYEPAGAPEWVDVRPGRAAGASSGSLTDAACKPGDFAAILIPMEGD